mmetsp:Transcript_40602/g.105404  ORF Transcript_40602/g.105404 Transcript_40602/m.105404 type:complete len:91 (+) Transcript_40602:364-636(+)
MTCFRKDLSILFLFSLTAFSSTFTRSSAKMKVFHDVGISRDSTISMIEFSRLLFSSMCSHYPGNQCSLEYLMASREALSVRDEGGGGGKD